MTRNELVFSASENHPAIIVDHSTTDKGIYLENIRAALAGATFKAYAGALARFSEWCNSEGRAAVPATPGTIAAYIGQLEREGRKAATILQAVAGIAKAHRVAGVENPCSSEQVRAAVRAMKRRVGVAPKQKAAATTDVLQTIVAGIDGKTLLGKRDRALLLCGFAGAFRRSELVALRLGDLNQTTDDTGRAVIEVTVRRSKTDQIGEGMVKALFAAHKKNAAFCPVRALREWIAAAGLTDPEAPLFPRVLKGDHLSASEALAPQAVALVLKKRAAAAGVELDLAGHSLRRGFVTSAISAGASERSIMYQTGHKSPLMVRRYIERRNAVTDNAAALLG